MDEPFRESSVPATPAIDKLDDILAFSENFLEKMHEMGQSPHSRKSMQRLFTPSEAAEMVGRDRTTLARAGLHGAHRGDRAVHHRPAR